MCELVDDLQRNTTYRTPRDLLLGGIRVQQDDLFDADQADHDGLIRTATWSGTEELAPPYSPWDTCLCGVDLVAALNRTVGIVWRNTDSCDVEITKRSDLLPAPADVDDPVEAIALLLAWQSGMIAGAPPVDDYETARSIVALLNARSEATS